MGLRVPSVHKLQKSNSLITSVVFAAANIAGLHLSMALQGLLDGCPQPQSKAPSFVEVDVPSELKKRPFLRGIGRLATPAEEMANSFSQELPEAANASPPSPPYCSRNPQDLPWRIGKTSRRRARGGERSHQRQRGRHSPRLNTAQMAAYRPRIIIAGELPGAWGKFGGFGGQLCRLSHRL